MDRPDGIIQPPPVILPEEPVRAHEMGVGGLFLLDFLSSDILSLSC